MAFPASSVCSIGVLASVVALSLSWAAPASALIVFGAPAPLHDTASTDTTEDDQEVSLATDGASGWVAAWYSENDLGGAVGPDFDILVSRSSDGGRTWTPAAAAMAAAATDGSAADTSPELGYGNGVHVLAFVSNNSLGATIGSDLDVLYSRSTDGGASWSPPALLNTGGAADLPLQADQQPSLATDGAGNWVAAWRRVNFSAPTGHQVHFSYSTDDGQTWAAEQPLGGFQSASVGNGQGTAVAWNGSDFVAAWGSSEDLSGNGNDGDLLVSTIAVPAWTAGPAALLNDSGAADAAGEGDRYPALAADGATLLAVWESDADVAGAGSDFDVFVSRSTDGGVTWAPAGPLTALAASDTGEDVAAAIAAAGSTVLVLWESTEPLGKVARSDRDIFVVRSDDFGASWGEVGVLASNAGKDKGDDRLPALAADASTGTWNAAWVSTDKLGNSIDEDEDILFVRSSDDCPVAPVAAASCFETTVAGSSSLLLRDKDDKDSILWKLLKGPLVDKAADIGSPDSTDHYVLCVYDETATVPALISELDIPAGGSCFVKPCWKETSTGFKYKNKFGVASVVQLSAGEAGKSKLQVKGKKVFRAPLMPLVQDPTLSVRLHNLGNGRCFAANYSTNLISTAEQFKAASD